MNKKKVQAPKPRNWLAVHAFNRKGGPMRDKKKVKNKKACRQKVRV